jgi:hypothetical protein
MIDLTTMTARKIVDAVRRRETTAVASPLEGSRRSRCRAGSRRPARRSAVSDLHGG